ncbi:MAG: alpha/beta hydrolase [Acetobacteraceae bacterium]|nr:alpha/beta hydrolase [Acetobacteraceae bacterium]
MILFLIGVVLLVILALLNYGVARVAEQRHPPTGSFMEVSGVRLHYSDRGTGRPIVLIHGNAVSGGDYNTSGVAERLVGSYRVIVFDRPGFGYSERPRGRQWMAAAQADLLQQALVRLDVRRPVVVGHSWGTLVALALATRHRGDIAGLVLLGGYYFPTARLDALAVAPVATPVIGDVLRYTVSPLFGWLTMPGMKRAMFAPSPMTPRFTKEYSTAMALRPWQIRATASDGTLMVPSAAGLSADYSKLAAMPVVIMAGDGDLIVGSNQAERLHEAIPGSELQIVEGVGHMLHHVVTDRVVEAVQELVQRSGPGEEALAASAISTTATRVDNSKRA